MQMKALSIYAGSRAIDHIRRNGLSPADIKLIPAAAGGPKGLILTHLDRFLFADWLPKSKQPVDLVGASIGAWRMASAMTPNPRATLELFASGYTDEYYVPPKGRRLPTQDQLSDGILCNLQGIFGAHIQFMMNHERFRLHVLTSRGKGVLHKASGVRAAFGFATLAISNSISRKTIGSFLERVIFSSEGLPLELRDLPTRYAALTEENFYDVMRAACSIPFIFRTTENIMGIPSGAFWDGGIIDYHLHWNYDSLQSGLVLYPHYQRNVVAGWLDKPLKWRKPPASDLSNVILLAPNPSWVSTLPGRKLPDRTDLTALSYKDRRDAWQIAMDEAQLLAEEFACWVDRGAPLDSITPLEIT